MKLDLTCVNIFLYIVICNESLTILILYECNGCMCSIVKLKLNKKGFFSILYHYIFSKKALNIQNMILLCYILCIYAQQFMLQVNICSKFLITKCRICYRFVTDNLSTICMRINQINFSSLCICC